LILADKLLDIKAIGKALIAFESYASNKFYFGSIIKSWSKNSKAVNAKRNVEGHSLKN